MFGYTVIFLLSAIFVCCESYTTATNNKCGLDEETCQKDLLGSVIQGIGPDGIPELNIPAIDPYKLTNIDFVIAGMIKVTVIDGFAKGVKTCRVDKIQIDTDKLVASVQTECENVEVDTTYKIERTPFLESILGSIKIHGEGRGGIVIEKLQLKFEIPFEIKKLEDGEPHAVILTDMVTYEYKILDKITFAGDNLYVGKQDISTVAVNIMNENWEFVSNTFAKTVLDIAVNEAMRHINKYFVAVPLKDLISTDVSSYISA